LAYVAWFNEDVPNAIQLARDALNKLPQGDYMTRAWASLILGAMLRTLGDLISSEQVLMDTVSMSIRAGDIQFAVEAIWELGVLYQRQGRLNDLFQICQEALQLEKEHERMGGRQLLVTGYTYTHLALVYYQRNQIDRALQSAQKAVELTGRWGMADAILQSNKILASILTVRGEFEAAEDALAWFKRIASQISAWYETIAKSSEAKIRMIMGDLEQPVSWLIESRMQPDDDIVAHKYDSYLTMFRVLVLRGYYNKKEINDQLNSHLTHFFNILDNGKEIWMVIEILSLQAIFFLSKGNINQALSYLEIALNHAEPENFIRIFIDFGQPMQELLQIATYRSISTDYVERLLGAMKSEAAPVAKKMKVPSPISKDFSSAADLDWISDPLTERELQVLRLLDTALSVPEIADELYVSTSTVRSHVKNIYSKLGVHSRFEAVNRARLLNLIN